MLHKIIRMAAERIAKERKYRNTVWELQSLSDRSLKDLGLTRSDIQFVAAKNAGFGK